MKNKYLGLLAVAVVLVSLLAAALVLTLINFSPSAVPTERAQPSRALSVGEQRLINQLTRYQQALPEWFSAAPAIDLDYSVALFPARARPAADTPVFASRELQMVYRVEDQAVALIDNRLYRVGDQLPGGARLLSIGQDSVTLIESGQRRQLQLRRSGQQQLAPLPATVVYAIS
jgi:hypothetical protein